MAAVLGLAALPSSSVDALSWTDVNTCTITPLAPLISGTTVAGQFSLSCKVTSTVYVEVTVGEWDPVLVSGKQVNTFFPASDPTLALTPTVLTITPTTTTKTWVTTYKPCWNSETDKEEYGTRIRIMTNNGTTTKGWSAYQITTAPAINANTFAC